MKANNVGREVYEKLQGRMVYLFQRYNDEFQYEDIEDYQKNFQECLSELGDFDIISFEIKPDSSFDVIVDILGHQYLFYINVKTNKMGLKTIPKALKIDSDA